MRQLKKYFPDTEITVIAPVPYFPFTGKLFGQYGQYKKIPKKEVRFGITIYHPRYLVIPKLGMRLTPAFLYYAVKKQIKRLASNNYEFDIIDSHYFYPDGVACAQIAHELNKPISVTARGSDITYIPNIRHARAAITKCLSTIDLAIGVSQALVNEIVSIYPATKHATAVRNGVDLELFSPIDNRALEREKLSLKQFTLLMVGNLVELKGHHLVIEALTELTQVSLIIVGHGERENELKALAKKLGVEDRVNFIGGVQQHELPRYYSIADCLVLASSREGWPNVLLESMACGTPVIATNVWGTPEIIKSDAAGLLIEERTTDSIVNAVKKIQLAYPDRKAVRAYAKGYSWHESSRKLYSLFSSLIKERPKND